MKYFADFQYDVDPQEVRTFLENCLQNAPLKADKKTLTLIFSILDLTSLSEKDNATNVGKMCELVNLLTESYPELPSPAAVCIYPELVGVVRAKINNPLVNVASVGGGFPASQTFIEVKLKEIEMAVEEGADEIDIVLPVGKFLLGLYDEVFTEIQMIKEALGALHLKVILETSAYTELSEVRKAALLAMDAGADFIKTSTGKTTEGASPESFHVMCVAIKDFYSKTGKKVGIKAAGGISTVEKAIKFIQIAKCSLGEEWLDPERFRIGASRLANEVIRELYDKDDGFSYFG